MRERLTIDDAVAILGLPVRTLQAMASRGRIPGAAKFGRRWTFDLRKLRQLVELREREVVARANDRRHPLDAIGWPATSRAVLRRVVGTEDSAYTRMIQRMRASTKLAR